MTGYQEMLIDPSFAGQIVVPTYPLIGNYGINERDFESTKVRVASGRASTVAFTLAAMVASISGVGDSTIALTAAWTVASRSGVGVAGGGFEQPTTTTTNTTSDGSKTLSDIVTEPNTYPC